MKSTVKNLAVFFILCFVLIQDSSISGTADIATLAPSSAIILTGALQPISFSATNNKAYDIKTYHAEFSIPAGLTIADITATPVATKATIDTRKNLLIFEWSAVGQGATVTGNFTVSAATQGTYTLIPAMVFYTDYNRKTYNASCNSSAISIRDEFISPSSPRNIRSRASEGYIAIFWDKPADTDVAGYNISRRTAATDFVAIGQIAASPYADASVEDGTTYYYRVTAIDGSGNESEWSAETSETYVKLLVRTYAAPGITIAAVGDINGDGKPDLVAGDPTYTLGNGGNAKYQVGKVDIYYGGNTSGIPDLTIVGENAEDQFGYALTVVDMNNDGFDELIIGAPYYDDLYAATWPFSGKATNGGKVYVYSGGSQLSATPVYSVEGNLSLGCNGSCLYLYAERLGFSMAAAGDVNNDGYQDAAIGAPMGGMDHSGRILVLFGSANLSSPDTAQVAGPRADFNLGCTVAAAGDVNGDGYGDLISGNTGGDIYSFSNKVSLIYGGNYLSYVLEINAGSTGDGIAKVVSAAGDVNGDGYADFALSRRIYYGGPYPDAIADRILPDAPDFLSLLGDVNNDGFKDIFVSPGPKVYFGGAFAEYLPDILREGVTVLAMNDVDRDGIRETFVGADANALSVYSLASLVTATLPDIVILSPKNNFSTDQSAVTVSGIITGAITKLQVGGQYLPLQPDGTFAVLTPLSAGTNVIEINAETPAGKISKRWITVKQAPPKPLTLSLSMMDGAVYIFDAPMMVSGTVSDVTATVELNGVPANLYSDVSGIHFESAAVRLAEGRNTLTAIAQDGYGQTASVSVTVMLLTKGMLTGAVTDVATGLALPEVTVTVEGSQNTYTAITDAQGAYTLPGIAAGSFIVTFAKTGYFSQTSTGDIANGQVQTVNAQMTPLPPLAVSITAPQDGAVFSLPSITVNGTVHANATVTVNGRAASVNNGNYTVSATLIEGQNTITATATDQYGQTASADIAVTLTTTENMTGVVTDSLTGLPVSSALVTVTDFSNTTKNALTDANGSYAIPDMAPGEYTGTITKDGYITTNLAGTKLSGQKAVVSGLLNPILPIISGITPRIVAPDSVTITWATDQPSSSRIDYGATPSYGSFLEDPSLVTSHSVTLANLASHTTYHFKVTSTNSYGFASSSPDQTFTSSFIVTTVGDYGNIAVMEVTGNYDAKNPDNTLNDFSRQQIAKEFIRTHQDQYDFLVIVSNFDFAMPDVNAKAFYLEVKNDTQGIAKTVFDNSAAFGSSGKLQGTIDMGNIANLGVNPLDPVKFETTLDTLAHEQLHRWGAGVKFKNPDGTLNNALFGKDNVHWSYLLDTDGSLEYGNDWKANADGTFTSVSAPKYYSNLDLYLMGMIDKAQVAPMTLIENASIAPTLLPSLGTTITGTVRTVTIDDIIAAEGERIPNASTSQKTFKTGFIFITQTGTFDGSEPPAIESIRNAWAGRFAKLTGGKGNIADVIPSLTVTIISPSDGVTLTTPYTTVKGAVINSSGNETGVTVNGIPATVMGNQFIAEHVPLADGVNIVTVTATDTAGSTATSTVSVSAITGNFIRLSPTIVSGIAPLEALLKIDGTFGITNAVMSASGPVQPQVTGTAPDEYTVKLIAEGSYTFTVSATGPDGNTYQDSVTITVMNQTELDRLLKAKWEGMKTKLASQDVEGALNFFTEQSQDSFRTNFTVLAPYLPEIISGMGEFNLVKVTEHFAECDIRSVRNGETYSFLVLFVQDYSGKWGIRSF